jgi:hypothetical protein
MTLDDIDLPVVTDEICADAAEHFDESALSALVSIVALTSVVNGPTPRSRPSLARGSSRRSLAEPCLPG